MTTQQIIKELEHLDTVELLQIIEAATQRVKAELRVASLPNTVILKESLTKAADALWQDYAEDKELTAFTALDGQEFIHAAG